MTPTRWDAVVVGAGPAGAVTAALLARAGASVLLLDRAQFPRDKPCSEYLSPETTRVLERLGDGVLEEVEAAAPARLTGMKVVAPDGTQALGRFAADHGYAPPRPYGFALSRTVFDTILLRAAERAGAVVRQGVAVEDLLYEEGAVGGVVSRETGDPKGLPDGRGKREVARSRVVVGADGLRSVVARRLGYRRSGPPRRIALSAHVADATDVGDVGEMHVGRRGYVGLGPIGGGITTVALVVPAARAYGSEGALRDRFFDALEEFPGVAGRFRPERLTRAVLVTGPFAQWSRRSYAAGAILVGDAADFFDPFTGQGIYSAMRGAELAAETLIAALAAGGGPVPAAALAPYARARRRTFGGKWMLERLIGLGVGWPALATRVIRRLARRPDLADLLIGATGNFVPAGAVLSPRTLVSLLR
jgi:menaquinone-9 beta-reductase